MVHAPRRRTCYSSCCVPLPASLLPRTQWVQYIIASSPFIALPWDKLTTAFFYQLVASSSAHLPLASQLHIPDGVVEVEFSGLKYVVMMDKRSEQKLYKSKREMIFMDIILSTLWWIKLIIKWLISGTDPGFAGGDAHGWDLQTCDQTPLKEFGGILKLPGKIYII